MIGPTIERIAAFRMGDIPLGKIALLTFGLGVAAPLLAQAFRVSTQIPPALSGIAGAWASNRFLKPILGQTGAEVMALSLGWTGVEGQFQPTRQIQTKLAQLLSPGQVSSGAVPGQGSQAGTVPVVTPTSVATTLTEVEGKIAAALQNV